MLTFFGISFGQKDSLTIPAVEAQFPGGQKALLKYLGTNVTDKLGRQNYETPVEKVFVRFYVDIDGKTSDAKIVKTSGHPSIDELLIEAINAMPKWTPAENSKGDKIGQTITLPVSLFPK